MAKNKEELTMLDDYTITNDGRVIDNLKEDESSPNAVISTLDNDGNIDHEEVEVGEVGPQFDPLAAVDHALNGEPLEFEDQIKIGLADRIQNAIERKRDEVAQDIFGNPDTEVAVDDSDAEEGDTEEDAEVDSEEEEEDQSEE